MYGLFPPFVLVQRNGRVGLTTVTPFNRENLAIIIIDSADSVMEITTRRGYCHSQFRYTTNLERAIIVW